MTKKSDGPKKSVLVNRLKLMSREMVLKGSGRSPDGTGGVVVGAGDDVRSGVVAALSGWVYTETENELAQLDYRRYFVIALFRGNFASSGYDAIIQRVARQDDRLVVHVQFWAPSPYYAVTAAASQPYDVVKVLRDGGALSRGRPGARKPNGDPHTAT
jgi:hypothetical protein